MSASKEEPTQHMMPRFAALRECPTVCEGESPTVREKARLGGGDPFDPVTLSEAAAMLGCSKSTARIERHRLVRLKVVAVPQVTA
jgi:hypothetical protein